ncbi:nucleotidyltransferase domain-containing protein [Jeotgalibacillus sp. ET6]|uniref:nucleotidyltransferase domain-containing protein n=1 Tax=Jeotgalibacillus sp. ET6 TaxID=3037260 RepID=UPI0024184614|nr:nucleotidyltransferase domain-containing protein [Jeotgalibacillus sp. ET6]MDG5471284.1 nucleotidyltransferase domain-containing protein [Jeotgalibacillus sp. ET6]
MRLSGIEAAKKFTEEKFPESEIVFLAGSASRGEETASSDLDIVIIDNSIISSYRESFVLYEWKIETFFHNATSYLNQFNKDKDTGRPILANMLAEGKAIRDNGKSNEIKNNAKEFIKAGPNPLSESYIMASRYFIFDLLDDFTDTQNHQEALMTLNTISLQFADFILRINGQWTGRGKGLTRALRHFDKEIYKRYFEALDYYYIEKEKQPIIDFVNEFYAPLGGPLFNGFSQGK